MQLKFADGALELKGMTEPTEEAPHYILKGYASIFGNTDLDGDIIERGAFVKSLGERTPLLLVNHKMTELPVGVIREAREDEKGLYFEAALPKADTLVRDRLAPQLAIGAIKGVSIGFRTTDSEPIKNGRGRRIKSADLFEISVVNLPANPRAHVASVKSVSIDPDALLPLQERVKFWEPDRALERVKSATGATEKPNDAFAKCFLYVDTNAPDDFASYKFLIADVDGGCLKANQSAVYAHVADVLGRRDDDEASDEVKAAVVPLLAAYYEKMGLPHPSESITKSEYLNLLPRQREARLRAGVPCSKGLSSHLGQRDAGRTRRDAGSNADEIRALVEAVRQLTEKAKSNGTRPR